MKRNSYKDLVGYRFGRLRVVCFFELKTQPNGNRISRWLCVCDCGKLKRVTGHSLMNGNTRSCGCLRPKHGHYRFRRATPTWNSWSAMLKRCYYAKGKFFPRYGGRGITVCKRWRKSFSAFLKDMGVRPKGKTLDRRKNDGNYNKNNCRWATPAQQRTNQSKKTS